MDRANAGKRRRYDFLNKPCDWASTRIHSMPSFVQPMLIAWRDGAAIGVLRASLVMVPALNLSLNVSARFLDILLCALSRYRASFA
jgi:hypothetical protein